MKNERPVTGPMVLAPTAWMLRAETSAELQTSGEAPGDVSARIESSTQWSKSDFAPRVKYNAFSRSAHCGEDASVKLYRGKFKPQEETHFVRRTARHASRQCYRYRGNP